MPRDALAGSSMEPPQIAPLVFILGGRHPESATNRSLVDFSQNRCRLYEWSDALSSHMRHFVVGLFQKG